MLYQRGISVAISAGDLPLAVEFVESRRVQHLAQRTALHPSQLGSQPDVLQNKNDADVASSRQRYTTFVERRRALQSALHGVWFGDSPKTAEQTAKLREALEQQRLAYGELNAHAMARTTADKSGPFDVLDVEGLRAAFNQRFGRAWTAVQIEPGVVTKGDRADAWWLMVLTPNELTIEPIQLQGEIDRRSLESLSRTDLDWRKQMLTESKAPFFRRVSALLQVDRWLPQDAAPDHTLIMAGCEPFIHVPLATLVCASGERLVERAVLRHAPSWNVAAHLCTRRARHVREAVKPLLVAPVSFGGRHPALPASAAEIQALRALWPHSDTLLQDQATSQALNDLNQRGALLHYDLLHFATHVQFDAQWSRVSGIALHDDDLWLQDLLDWRLDAELVCVSGCEAGRGSPVGGEESLGIEAAFIAAGAHNVVSPQWHVRDTVANEIVLAFMRDYQQTDDLGLALTRTQRRFARTLGMMDWAAWRVFGMH